MNKEKWNEICFLLSDNIQSDINESDFEQRVLLALRVLGWKEFKEDIQIRPSFQIGAANRIMPDFVISSSGKENLFVIEIKQPNIPLSTSFQQQLFSYMRQLRLQYGVLIGQVIQVFYDGDLSNHDTPVLLETIEFDKENSKGTKFVELFSKETFSDELLQSFTLNSLKKINRKTEQNKLRHKILSKEYQTDILELIKQDFLNKYDSELLDNVLSDISVSVTTINQPQNQLEIPSQMDHTNKFRNVKRTFKRDNTKYLFKGMRLGKGRFVLEFIKEYTKRYPQTFNELKQLFPDSMQGSTGVINTMEHILDFYQNDKNKRHYIKDGEVLTSTDNIQFAVSSQWGIHNIITILDFAKKAGFEYEEVN